MLSELIIETSGERFYDITDQVKNHVSQQIRPSNGLIQLFLQHTSCALCVNEAFDNSARTDMEKFLKHLAPRNLAFIEHTTEGPDDSPSHMKTLLLQTDMNFIVHKGELLLGRWQGIYLAEFRDQPHQRKLWVKYMQG